MQIIKAGSFSGCFLLRKNDQIILLVQEKSSGMELKEVVRLVTASCGAPAFLSIAQEQRRNHPTEPLCISPSVGQRPCTRARAGMPAQIKQSLDGEALAESGSFPAKLSLF